MKKEEFMGLPPSVALGLLWDALGCETLLAGVEKPKPAFPPKYDLKVYRKNGWNWASELPLETLLFWCGKAKESADGGGPYAEKDRKKVESLQRWIAWRLAEPTARWKGERNNSVVTAAEPSRDPKLYTEDEPGPATDGDIPF